MGSGSTRQLSTLVENVVAKATGRKDATKPYVGLENMSTGSSYLNSLCDSRDFNGTSNVFEPSDILFGKLRPQLRKCVQVDFSGYCSTDILVLRTLAGNSPRYAAYVLQSDLVFLEAIRTEEGTRMPRTSWAAIRCCEFPNLSLSEQRKIARILTTVDDLIERTQALIAKYQAIKQGLLHDLLTRGIDQHGRLRPPPSQAPELYKESPLGLIPKDWEVKPLESCAIPGRGGTVIGPFGSDLVMTDYRAEGVPVVFVRDVKPGRFEWTSEVYVDERKALALTSHSVHPGDILATKMGLPPCIACVYPQYMDNGIVTADIIRLRPNSAYTNAIWLASAINHDYIARQVTAITAGVTRPKVTLRDFRNLKVAIPALHEQNQQTQRLFSIDSKIRILQTELEKLYLQKTGLMQDLLTGRVRVTVDDE